MINDTFGEKFLTTINNIAENPTHLLFNQWWNQAPEDVRNAYVDQLMSDPDFRAWVEEGHYAEPLDLENLKNQPEGSLGRSYHDWIVDNNLTAQIAMNYRNFHQMLVDSGELDGMPEEARYAVLRGFQVHDFLHVLTGYDSSGRGEIALQAFCLAQLQFPYFSMWMSVVTAQMTFLDPSRIVPLMDAISDGWQYGRSTPNLMYFRWEEVIDQPLEEVRKRFSIAASPLVQELQGQAAA